MSRFAENRWTGLIAFLGTTVFLHCSPDREWGSVTINRMGDEIAQVTLENDQVRVKYAHETVTGWASRQPVCIVEFIYKKKC